MNSTAPLAPGRAAFRPLHRPPSSKLRNHHRVTHPHSPPESAPHAPGHPRTPLFDHPEAA